MSEHGFSLNDYLEHPELIETATLDPALQALLAERGTGRHHLYLSCREDTSQDALKVILERRPSDLLVAALVAMRTDLSEGNQALVCELGHLTPLLALAANPSVIPVYQERIYATGDLTLRRALAQNAVLVAHLQDQCFEDRWCRSDLAANHALTSMVQERIVRSRDPLDVAVLLANPALVVDLQLDFVCNGNVEEKSLLAKNPALVPHLQGLLLGYGPTVQRALASNPALAPHVAEILSFASGDVQDVLRTNPQLGLSSGMSLQFLLEADPSWVTQRLVTFASGRSLSLDDLLGAEASAVR